VDAEGFTLTATNKEAGEVVTATGVKGDGVGRYTVEITFPSDGRWAWQVTPAPYPEFDMPTLIVLTPGSAADEILGGALNIDLARGTCGGAYEEATSLDLTSTGDENAPMMATIPGSLSDLTSASRVLVVRGADGAALACGELLNAAGTDRLVVAVAPVDGSQTSGIIVLDQGESDTTLAYYPVTLSTTGKLAEIEIVGGSDGDWRFEPSTLEVEAGTTVVWKNSTTELHTIAGQDLSFEDSGIIEPGGSFTQTFTEAGTYVYKCGPHQWMTGTIVVS
jgi:plastocyanin